MLQSSKHLHTNKKHQSSHHFQQLYAKDYVSQVNCKEKLSSDSKAYQNDYKYLTLDHKLQTVVDQNLMSPSDFKVRCKTEEIATTVLLSESQKEGEKYQLLFNNNSLRSQHLAKISANQTQSISPFDESQAKLEKRMMNGRRHNPGEQSIKKDGDFWNHRYQSIPISMQKEKPASHHSPQSKQNTSKCIKMSRVAINTPELGHLFPQENCFYSTKLWKHALASGKQHQINRARIRKSISLSLCEIAQRQDSTHKPMMFEIQKLLPSKHHHSRSFPLKIEQKVDALLKSPTKTYKFGSNSDRNIAKIITIRKPTQNQSVLITLAQQQKKQAQPKVNIESEQTNKFSKQNMNSIFRKLNAFKKYSLFQAIQEREKSPKKNDQQRKVERRMVPLDADSKLTQIRYKLMKTGFKLRKTASYLNDASLHSQNSQ